MQPFRLPKGPKYPLGSAEAQIQRAIYTDHLPHRSDRREASIASLAVTAAVGEFGLTRLPSIFRHPDSGFRVVPLPVFRYCTAMTATTMASS
jgi:hypothetical protein